jgi:hypothetical protein
VVRITAGRCFLFRRRVRITEGEMLSFKNGDLSPLSTATAVCPPGCSATAREHFHADFPDTQTTALVGLTNCLLFQEFPAIFSAWSSSLSLLQGLVGTRSHPRGPRHARPEERPHRRERRRSLGTTKIVTLSGVLRGRRSPHEETKERCGRSEGPPGESC